WETVGPPEGGHYVNLRNASGGAVSKPRESARPDIGMRRDLQRRLDWKQPARVARRCGGQGFVEDAGGRGVVTGGDQLRGLSHRRIDRRRTAAGLQADD